MKYLFVDGYNVINAWSFLREAKQVSFDAARQALVDKLLNYAAYSKERIILVFDAHLQPGSIEKKERVNEYLTIIFTKEGQTADSYIEKEVNSLGRKIEVCVVTSDSLEQQLAFQRGATRMSSLEFYHEMIKIEKNIGTELKKKNSENRNLLGDRIQRDVLEKLEKIRRSP